MLTMLLVASDPFFPENRSGVNKTLYNILKTNSLLRVTFLCSWDERDLELPQGFDHVTLELVKRKNVLSLGLGHKLKRLLSPDPYIKESNDLIEQLAARVLNMIDDYDLVQLGSLALAPILDFIPPEKRDKVIICAIDSVSYFYESRIANESNALKALVWKLELSKTKRYEAHYYALAKAAFFVSPQDREYAEEHFGNGCLYINIPYGVDTDAFAEEMATYPHCERNEKSLIFTGNFNYAPNKEAAHFLIHKVMPLVWEYDDQVKLFLAGANPGHDLTTLEDERLVVTGFVESMVPYLLKCPIFVSPIFFGAGVKTKVLEAMFMENVVLGTANSFHAIECQADRDCLIVHHPRDAKEWAISLRKIFADREAYRQVGANAKKAILASHDWNKVRLKYNEKYQELAGREPSV